MQITIYTIPMCGTCETVKTWLRDRNIEFDERPLNEIADMDIALDAFGKREHDHNGLQRLLGAHSWFKNNGEVAPVILVDNSGVTDRRLKELVTREVTNDKNIN